MTFVCLAIYAMVSPAREFEQPGPRESPGSARDTQIVVLAKLSNQILPGIVLTPWIHFEISACRPKALRRSSRMKIRTHSHKSLLVNEYACE